MLQDEIYYDDLEGHDVELLNSLNRYQHFILYIFIHQLFLHSFCKIIQLEVNNIVVLTDSVANDNESLDYTSMTQFMTDLMINDI